MTDREQYIGTMFQALEQSLHDLKCAKTPWHVGDALARIGACTRDLRWAIRIADEQFESAQEITH